MEQDPGVAIFPDLAGKTAAVTGGSRGIGAATCRALIANGVKVAMLARDRQRLEAFAERLRAEGGDVVAVAGDAREVSDLHEFRTAAQDQLGPVDLLFSFAGGFGSYTSILEITDDEWSDVIDSNLTSSFRALREFLPAMVERGRGAVVTMASNSARLIDVPLTASYAAAKAGVVQLTRHAAKEVGSAGVRINCVAPATTSTERVEEIMSDETRRRVIELSPLGRLGTPMDSAAAALFLASDAAGWLTGVTLDVAGGRVMI